MSLNRFALRLGAVSLLGLTAAAHAAPVAISNAAYAATYAHDCRSLAAVSAGSTVPDRCEVNGQFTQGPGVLTRKEVKESLVLGGHVASATATTALAIAGGEATRSMIDVSGAAGELALKQGAFSGTTYSRVSGHSLGLQSFQYTGTGDSQRTIQNVFDYTSNVALNSNLNAAPDGGVITDAVAWAKTRVSVFSLATGSFNYDNAFALEVQYGGFMGQASKRADYRLEGQVFSEGIQNSGDTTAISFTMQEGRFYFVDTYLGLWARFGAQLDATHTFTSTLGVTNDSGGFVASNAGLVAAAQLDTPIETRPGNLPIPVPEPGSLAIVALGLGLLAGTRRRA